MEAIYGVLSFYSDMWASQGFYWVIIGAMPDVPNDFDVITSQKPECAVFSH